MLPLARIEPWMFAVAAALLALFAMRMWRQRSSLSAWRAPGDDSPSGPPRRLVEPSLTPRKDMPLADAPPELLRWEVEMHETARELKAEIDSKLSAFQALIRLAREETQRLEAALARAERLPGAEGEWLNTAAEDDPLESSSTEGGIVRQYTGEETTPGAPWTEERRRQALRLAKEGRSAAAIASELGVPVGDVEFELRLLG